jgi:mono/diheme cytochrome c family protein
MKFGIAGLVILADAIVGSSFLSPYGQTAAAPQTASAITIWDGIYTEEQARRGQALYGPRCAYCHGDALTDGNQGPPLAGDAFLTTWKGNPLSALFTKTSAMMPSDDPGSLTNEQCADLLAYMLSVNKAPAGKTEIKGDPEALKQIRIEVKPEKPGR